MDQIFITMTRFGDRLLSPIGRQLNYLYAYKKNVGNLQKQVEKLKDMRDDVLQSADAAMRNGHRIKETVRKWLTEVEHIIAEAELLSAETNLDKRCFKGLSPDWLSRYKLSKEAYKKAIIVTELQGGKPIEDVFITLPPLNIEFPSYLKQLGKDENNRVSLLPKVDKSGVQAGASASTVNPKIVQQKKTMDEIIAEQNGTLKQIIFQQREAVDQIFNALQDENCEIIGIYGMGGIGKTTLAKEIGKMAKTSGLFDEVVMAVISQNQDIRKIQCQIGDMLGLWFSEESDMGRAGRLYERLTYKERILLILDDVWASINLTAIGIPCISEGNSCKIVITTRQRNICNIMGFQSTKEIPVKLLSEEESWDLFKKNAESKTNLLSTELALVAMEVARECGGLPLAIVTVARTLRDKYLEEWKAALLQLKKSKPLNVSDVEKDIFSCLKLSYDYLRSEEAKACFLFSCLFPEDHDIKIEDIARYGFGKGLFTNADTMEEARRQTQWIVRNLKDSCLLLESSEENCVKMHDMVRDFAISIVSEKKFGFLVKAGLGLNEWPNRETWEENAIISLMANKIQALPEGLNCPRLEMLMLGENEGLDIIPEGFFEGMKMLRVLDLSERIGVRSLNHYFRTSQGIPVQYNALILPSSFKALVNLRTLYLDHCKLGDITVLGKLKKLEIVSLCGSDIKELPNEVGELINLRLLDLNFCQKLETIPPNLLSRLIRLEELYMGETFRQWRLVEGTIGETSKACISELTSLSHLTNLCLQVVSPESIPQNLHLLKLQQFEIAIGPGYHPLTCYPNSRSLYLREIKTSIPEAVKNMLQTVEDLTVFCMDDKLIRSILDAGQVDLKSLKSLKVISCLDIVFMIDTPAPNAPAMLASLESLHLYRLEDLKCICYSSLPLGSLQKLQVLKVENCGSLFTVVTAPILPCLLSLKEVHVERSEWVSSIFELQRIVAEEELLLLSNLMKISLKSLPVLRNIWRGLDPCLPVVRLSNLKVVEIYECRNLTIVFPFSIAKNLLQLEVLKLNWCSKLRSIVAMPEVSENNDDPVCFLNLKIIEVAHCNKLKHLFSVSEARNLRQLKEIKLCSSFSLVVVINHEEKGKEDEMEDKTIVLPQLNSIQLTDLHDMNSLCAKPFAVDLPSLENLVLGKCPNMENFVSDASKYGLESAPELKRAQIEEHTLHGTEIEQLFGKKRMREIDNEGHSLEMKPLLKHTDDSE